MLTGVLIYTLAPILSPFLGGVVLAYILNPGVDRLVKWRVPRSIAVIFMLFVLLLTATLLVLLAIPVLQREIVQVQEQLPKLLTLLNDTVAPKLREWFGLKLRFDAPSLKKFFSQKWLENAEDILTYGAEVVRTGSGTLLGWLATILLVPVVTFYFLTDWHNNLSRVSTLIPRHWQTETLSAMQEIDAMLSQYLRGQLLVMLVLAAYYSGALYFAGLDLALPIGVLTGLLIFIPYVGFSLGFLMALLSALLQFQSLTGLGAVAAVYGVGQLLESFLLTPRLVGERIGLHPLAVIFALMAFGYTFGFIGVLLALPISAACLVGLKRLKGAYLVSDFYNGK